RSHIEVPVVIDDALRAAVSGDAPAQARGHWQIHSKRSPTSQRDWADRWPDLASQSVIVALERLRTTSVPLANICTIRGVQEGASAETVSKLRELCGIYVQSSCDEGDRKVVVHSPFSASKFPAGLREAGGFLLLLPEASWIAPLSAYLKSETTHEWLDHHAERKGERWSLNEQVVRWIPVPQLLLAELTRTGVQHHAILDELAASPKN